MFLILITVALCRIANAIPTSRIVNGTDADVGDIPYIVSLRLARWHSCGGSILNPYFILTAAHCVYDYLPTAVSIQYGVVEISNDHTNSIQVEKIIVHEDYVPVDGYRNDIAILKLVSAIPFSNTVQAISLPTEEEDVEGWSIGNLAGWGIPYTGGSLIKHLQKVEIFIYPSEECQKAHGSSVDGIYHVCGGVPEGGKGQCNGDSGGPLTYRNVQVGIVSWSIKPCTIAGYPGVFTRVAHHVNWIKKHLEN